MHSLLVLHAIAKLAAARPLAPWAAPAETSQPSKSIHLTAQIVRIVECDDGLVSTVKFDKSDGSERSNCSVHRGNPVPGTRKLTLGLRVRYQSMFRVRVRVRVSRGGGCKISRCEERSSLLRLAWFCKLSASSERRWPTPERGTQYDSHHHGALTEGGRRADDVGCRCTSRHQELRLPDGTLCLEAPL